MESPIARVIAIADGRVRLVVAAAACPRCASGKGCGAGLLARPDAERELEIDQAGRWDLEVGDTVRLSLDPARLLHATLLVYGLPLAGLVLVPALAWLALGPLTDGSALLAAAVGLIAGLIAARRRVRRNCLRQFVPAIAGRVSSAQATDVHVA